MASYLLKGITASDLKVFQARCKLARVHPGVILATFLKNAEPRYDKDANETRLTCAVTVHH